MFNTFQIIPTDVIEDASEADRSALALNVAELVSAGLASCVDPGEAIGLSQDYFDGLHTLAARYYADRRFDDASLLFRRLVQLRPTELPYLKGLGATQLGLERYEEAEKIYSMVYAFDATDPESSYYLGLSQYHLKKFEPAFDNLRFARVLAEAKPQAASPLAAWATQLLERMKPLVPPEQAALIDKRG